MSKHDDSVSLQDMLKYANEARELLGDVSREALKDDRMRQLALTHLMEIVGEAANRVSRETQQLHPEVPWRQIIGMRNRLVHGYDVIEYALLWDTVASDLPPLIATLETIVDAG